MVSSRSASSRWSKAARSCTSFVVEEAALAYTSEYLCVLMVLVVRPVNEMFAPPYSDEPTVSTLFLMSIAPTTYTGPGMKSEPETVPNLTAEPWPCVVDGQRAAHAEVRAGEVHRAADRQIARDVQPTEINRPGPVPVAADRTGCHSGTCLLVVLYKVVSAVSSNALRTVLFIVVKPVDARRWAWAPGSRRPGTSSARSACAALVEVVAEEADGTRLDGHPCGTCARPR